jgi:hypothetical protein
VDLLKEKLPIARNRPTDDKKYDVIINNGKDNTDIRATETGAYTISYWMYISEYSGNSNYQSVMCIQDVGVMAGEDTRCLLMFALHPTQPKLFVNVGCLADDTNPSDMERISSAGVWKGRTTTIPDTDAANSCNVVDVDLQRWIHVAVSVNKQIVDVYMDGKLARSCVLSRPQKPSLSGQQNLRILPAGDSFKGYISGIHFSAYADTPDHIYGRYQSGPYTATSFWDYLSDKLGIRIQYTGTQGNQEFSEWNLKNTLLKYFPSE